MSLRLRLIAVALVGAASVAFAARAPARQTRAELTPLLLRPSIARTVSKSFLPLLIDVYWLRAVNAIGETDSKQKNRSLYDYGVLLHQLDPRFYAPYEYLGLNIPFREGRDEFANADLASDLFRKGLSQYPNDVKLHLFLGFTLFYMEHKYLDASKVFARAATLPGSPSFCALLSTRLLTHQGNAEEALALTRELLATTEDEATRAELEGRMSDLELEIQLQAVDKALRAYAEAEGRPAATLDELNVRGYYSGPRVDVRGGAIMVGEDGRAASTSLGRRLVLFEHE